MKARGVFYLLIFLFTFPGFNAKAQDGTNKLQIKGTRFEMNGKPFEYTGISFFNAIYNEEFNRNSSTRQAWMQKFLDSGINVLRIWCQWDNAHGFIDAGEGRTIFKEDGTIKPEQLQTIKAMIMDADEKGMVILLVFFSRESWNENLRLSDKASENAVSILARELKPFGNVVFQVWNEFNYRTIEYYKIIKSIDKERLVTNSPGYAGDLGSLEENRVMDFFVPSHFTKNQPALGNGVQRNCISNRKTFKTGC